jgi:hypothetical protein
MARCTQYNIGYIGDLQQVHARRFLLAEILFKLALNTITLTLKRASIIITQRYYYLKLVSEKKIAESI